VTLLRLEVTKLRHQKRTWFGYAGLAVVPLVATIALSLSHSAPDGEEGLAFLGGVFRNGLAVPVVTLLALSPFLMPLAASMVGAFMIAGEAETGTLKTILVRPVHRGALLAAKFEVAVLYLLSALVVVFTVALTAGRIAFGVRPLVTPIASFGVGGMLWRGAVAYLLCLVAMAAVVALALLFSTLSNSSLTAAILCLVLVMVVQILTSFSYFGFLKPWVFTTSFTAWSDLFRTSIPWWTLAKTMACPVGWSALLTVLAWLRFRRRDILI